MNQPITPPRINAVRLLLVEDNPGDVILLSKALSEAGDEQFELTIATRLSDAVVKLKEPAFDLILADQGLPDSRGLETFASLHAQAPELPIVVITGLDDDALGIEAVAAGAQDYLVKGQVSGPLVVRALRYAIERKRLERERDDLISRLTEALAEVKTLSGLLPICGHCKKIRDDQGYWQQIESYLEEYSGAEFSHGVCPQCMKEVYHADQ